MSHQELQWIDYLMMIIYFGFVLGIGFMLKRFMRTSSEFLTAGRSIPAWVAGLAFLSANLGAQEVIGMAASGAKYGIATSHFYWLGAIPAMVFLGVFMMPVYYGSKAHSVPDYRLLRFDKKTRSLNAMTFAVMTIMSFGISMYAMALLIQTLHIFDTPFLILGLPNTWVFHVSIIVSAKAFSGQLIEFYQVLSQLPLCSSVWGAVAYGPTILTRSWQLAITLLVILVCGMFACV